jgi:hypothetical protein
LKQQDGFIRDLELDTKQNTNEKSLEEPYTPSRAISQSTNQVSPQPLSSDLVPGAEKMVVYVYYLRNVGWLKVIVSGGFAALAIFANSFSRMSLSLSLLTVSRRRSQDNRGMAQLVGGNWQ